MKGLHQTASPIAPSWEESIVLIEAESETAAAEIAAKIGKSNEHQYVVAEPHEHILEWRFDRIERIFVIENELTTGCELFSRSLKDSEVASLLKPFD